MPELSLVVPVYNEEENLPLLMEAICTSMQPLNRDWEVIFVDDGSTDQSVNVLKRLVDANAEHARAVIFRRNFGQTAAIAAGIDHSRGSIIILLDADLQNDPADIPMLLDKLDEGYDLVSGWRKDRQDNALTRNLPSHMANSLISSVTGVHLHDYGCTLKAYRRDALEGFRLYGEMHRFIPVFAHSVGAKITELPVHHHARRFGKAKYGLERTVKVILDLFTVKFLLDYSHKPMRLFGGAGITMMFFSVLTLLALFIRKLIEGIPILTSPIFSLGVMFFSVLTLLALFVRKLIEGIPILTSPIFSLGVMFFILGFQSILMGLIAELLARTYHESQKKPTYTIRQILGK